MYRTFPVPAPAPERWRPVPAAHPVRRLAARHLRRTGAWLAWLARQLVLPAAAPPVPGPLPEIEFCAEAGAPEGALFVNGEYVGHIEVARL